MCAESEGVVNTVLPDGKCTKCKNRVHNNFVTCLFCSCKFHATGCSNNDICTPTFLSSFKPFSEKTAPKYASRPGNFHFVCDACITNFEIKRASSQSDKVDSLTTKVCNLENGLNEIKTLLKNQSKAPVPKIKDGIVSGTKLPQNPLQPKPLAPWATSNMFAPLANDDEIDVVDDHKQLSAIVIPAMENETLKKSQMKVINRAVMQSKMSIRNSFQKKNGETVILCNSDQTRDALKAEIENVVPNIEVKSPSKCRDTIAVVGFDDDYGEEIISALVDQNFFMHSFAMRYNLSDHLKYVDTKPLRNDSERFQATFRIPKELRQVLQRHNDRLIIGVISCRIYNRVFIKRCALCQRFGHFFGKCEFKDEPKCAICGEDHETNDCLNKSCKKCINCVRANYEDTNHEAFSKQCSVYREALKNFKDSSLN